MTREIPSGASIAIIGAGIIGVSSAFALSRQGYEVTVYDSDPPGEAGPSRANAGHIAASDIYPLSAPGIHWKAIKMLLNRDGALKIPLSEAIGQLPWFWRFWCTSHPERFETATRALSYLCSRTLTDTKAMFDAADMADMYRLSGCAFLYDTEKSLNASKPGWAGKQAAGFESVAMHASEITQNLPALADHFQHGVLSHQWAMVSEPIDVVRGLAKAAQQSLGANFVSAGVTGFSPNKNGIEIKTNNGLYQHDAVVVAAGVGSTVFAKPVGDFLPMTAERGYNLTAPTPEIELDIPLVFADQGVVATQMNSGLRIGGWAEYANPNRPPNQNYFKSIARISKVLFPKLNLDNASYWMGNRPSLPDSVPVISRSTHSNRVFYACGHGHYGLTHAATSANILVDLIGGESDAEKYKAYSVARFSSD